MTRKAVKVYLSSPLLHVLEKLTDRLGLSDSEVLRLGLMDLAEKHDLMPRGE
jgi:hypothetical protein